MAENKESDPTILEEAKPEEGKEPPPAETAKVEGKAVEEKMDDDSSAPSASDGEAKAAVTEERGPEELKEEPAEPMDTTENQGAAGKESVDKVVVEPTDKDASTESTLKGAADEATEQQEKELEKSQEQVQEQEQEQPHEQAQEEEEEEEQEEEVMLMEVENKENISDNVTVSDVDSQEKDDTDGTDTPAEQCYCGIGRTFDDVELQCSTCLKWFHKACIKTVNVYNTVPYMTTYTFCCKKCSPTKVETFSRKVANFRELCHCALANLVSKHRALDPPRSLFSKEADLIPFIDAHWEQLTPMPRRTTVTWHGTIVKAMMKDDDLFICKEKPDDPSEPESDYPRFGLIDQDLSKISPYSESAKQGSNLRLDSSQKPTFSLNSSVNGNSGLSSSSRISRSAKRKGIENTQGLTSSKRTRGEMPSSQKLPAHGYPLEHPFNKDGYRYVLTEPDPHAPSSAFEEDQWIGKPIPAHLYRMAIGKDVLLALHDRAPQLRVSEDRLLATGHRGYCMVRATHGINRGAWYFEVTVDQMPEGSATRLGWSQPLGNLQAPLGYDKFSYSWRSRKGTRFHESRGRHYSAGYGEGDTLGFYIRLPGRMPSDDLIPPTYKDRALIKFKSHLYFEEKDQTSEAEKALQSTKGTKIVFYKNGESQGVAYEDIYEGTYHPAVSLYKQCTVKVNFGPDFKHPPKDQTDYRPVSDLAYLSAVEQTLSDILFLIEHEKDYELAARGVLIDI